MKIRQVLTTSITLNESETVALLGVLADYLSMDRKNAMYDSGRTNLEDYLAEAITQQRELHGKLPKHSAKARTIRTKDTP